MTIGLPDHCESVTELLVEHAPEDYDCIVGNIATLVTAAGIDPDLILGGVFVASPRRITNTTHDFDQIGNLQIHAACVASGLIVQEDPHEIGDASPGTVVAIGDGFDMPWSPYHRTHHVEHGFLVADDYVGFDAYNTVTEFGRAEPQILDTDQWRSVPLRRRLRIDMANIDPSAQAEPTVVHDESAVVEYRAAVEASAASIEQLAVDAWSLARARRVNLRYVASAAHVSPDHLRTSVDAWTAASEAVYVALRRFRRGRPVPTTYIGTVIAALDADRAVVGEWAAP